MLGANAENLRQFGDFVLNLEEGSLRRGEAPVFLRPKSHALLMHLAKHAGRVVPKSELMDVVWPDVYVTEDSLTQSVRDIRKILGEDRVRTVSKRGYMLVPEQEREEPDVAQPVVAVLRFRNEGPDPADRALIDGFAEDLIDGLARFGMITVLARHSSFAFDPEALTDWSQVRARIGADFIVEGALRRRDDRVLVKVGLVEAQRGQQIWSDRYEARGAGLFDIQHDIVGSIVGRLVTRVNNAGLERAARKPVYNLAAYELVLRGVALLRDPAQSDLKSAETFFQAASEKDPAYGLAYTYLALSRALAIEFGAVSADDMRKAREIADHGAILSPEVATCRRVQSMIRIYLREHEAAEHHLRLGLDLNPHDAECIEQMGFLLTMRGRPMEALGWFERAIKLNPLHPHWYQYDRSLALYLSGDYRAAASALELSSRPTPWIRTRLAACYAQLGQIDEARALAARIAEAGDGFSPLDHVTRNIPFESPADADHLAEGVRIALGLDSVR